MQSDLIGSQISHYHIEERLGEGGMGVVYRATDTLLGRQVALKFLPKHLLRDLPARERFLHEARAASSLDHSGIVAVHDIVEDQDRIFIVMALCEGESLKSRIERGPLSLEEAVRGGRRIAEALAHAHAKGVVHRDIKPANVMLTSDGEAKLVDFGLAKVRDVTLTESGVTLGTAAYMSPEQATGGVVDQRTDIWSFGAVLYEMLTGSRPFRGEYETAVVYAILNESPNSVSEIRHEVPPELAALVSRCLEKEPSRRFANGAELLEGLDAAVGATGSSGTVVASSSPRKPGWRRPAHLAGAAGAVVAVALVAALLSGRFTGSEEGTIRAIAVLPLANLSGDPEQEYFADGMTDALITELGRIGALRVVSRQSVAGFKNSEATIREVAERLNVDAVVEGSVLQADGMVRITVQLVDALADAQRWGESYARPLEEVLTLQDDLARAIAGAIQIELTPGEAAGMRTERKVDPAALELYLKGKHLLDSGTLEHTMEQSIALFEGALAIDSTLAEAWTGLAVAHYMLFGYGYRSPVEVTGNVELYAQRALAIDSTLSDAWTWLAAVDQMQWRWESARERAKHAIALNPNASFPRVTLAFVQTVSGRFDEAVETVRPVAEIDPLTVMTNVQIGRALFFARRYDEAVAVYRKLLDLDPEHVLVLFSLGQALVSVGRYEEAISTFLRRRVPEPERNWALGYAYARSGQVEKAREVLDYLVDKSRTGYVPPTFIAAIYAGLNDMDGAFEWLNRAARERALLLEYLNVDPWFDNLRSDPRYETLVDRLGLPPLAG